MTTKVKAARDFARCHPHLRRAVRNAVDHDVEPEAAARCMVQYGLSLLAMLDSASPHTPAVRAKMLRATAREIQDWCILTANEIEEAARVRN